MLINLYLLLWKAARLCCCEFADFECNIHRCRFVAYGKFMFTIVLLYSKKFIEKLVSILDINFIF